MNPNFARRPRWLAAATCYLRTPEGLGWTGAMAVMASLVCLAVGVALLTGGPHRPATRPAQSTLTGVLSDIAAHRVASARLDEGAARLTVAYRPGAHPTGATNRFPHARPAHPELVRVVLPVSYIHDVVADLTGAGVPLTVTDPATAGATPAPTPPTDTSAGAVPAQAAQAAETGGGASSQPADHHPKAAAAGHASRASTAGVTLVLVGVLLILAGLTLLLAAAVERHRRIEEARQQAATAATEPTPSTPARSAAGRGAKTTVAQAEVPDTRFSDVAGCDEAIAELTEMVMFLKEPDRFTRTGAKPPKGALLAGPPGTGKTLLARAVAGEAGVPFFAAAGSDFTEMYVGVGAKRVRDLFAAARGHDRAIVFIDEIDAVARKRSGAESGSNAETENTLVALLAEMDGFDGSNVIVLAATNRADILDPAITRPGRLDRKVEVPNPDRRGREKILAVHVAGKPVEETVDLVALARRTPGFSGAQLAALVNEACLEAVRRDQDTVDHDCFDHAVATIAMGRARTSALVTDHDRTVTAWHEAGHTLAAYLQPDADDPVQVTIVPRGPAGGVTWMSGSDDIFLSRRKAHAQLVTALAGRAAEEAYLDGEYTQGAHGDLNSATDLATRMVTQYGMTRLGYQVRNPNAASQEVSEVVEELLVEAHVSATALLTEHRRFLEAVATRLLDEETLTFTQVHEIGQQCGAGRYADLPVPPRPTRPARKPSAEETPSPAARTPGADTVRPAPKPARRPRPLVAVAARLRSRRRPPSTPAAAA